MIRKALSILIVALTVAAAPASAFDLKDLVKGATGAMSGGSGTNLGDLASGLLNGVLTTDKLEVSSLTGEWTYEGPAVCFKSDNLLQKAGGGAAAAAVEAKLLPLYKKAGLDGMTITIDADGNFTMKAKKMTLKGTIEKATGDGLCNFTFNFKAAGKIKIGKINAYVTKTTGTTMGLMFDVSKLMAIVKGAGQLTGNASVQGATKLLDSYDGLCAGFKLKK